MLTGSIATKRILNDEAYRTIFRRNFDVILYAHEFAANDVQPSQGEFDFSGVEAYRQFARRNSLIQVGGGLHHQKPDWVDGSEIDQRILLTNQCYEYTKRNPDIKYWILSNEQFNEDGSMKESIWNCKAPIRVAARGALAGNEDAYLIYNDFGNHEVNRKSDAIYRWAAMMKEQGLLHAVGFQMHLDVRKLVDETSVAANIRRLQDIGLDVWVTELDIRMKDKEVPHYFEAQGAVFEGVTKLLIKTGVKTQIMFDFQDANWIPRSFPGWGAATVMTEDLQKKPAWFGWKRGLRG